MLQHRTAAHMSTARLLFALSVTSLMGRSSAFVLTGVNSSELHLLPGPAQRWTVPEALGSREGLGGGLAWVIDESFCEQLLGGFPERSIIRGLAIPALEFVSCDDIKAAVLRGFATWTANHRLIRFSEITDTVPCANRSTDVQDPCPWELYLTTDDVAGPL